MSAKHKGGQSPKNSSAHKLNQTDRHQFQGTSQTPGRGARSNPGNVEAGVGHTRGHNRPGSNTGGRGRDAAD